MRIEEFNDLFVLPNVTIMKSRATKPVGHVGCWGGEMVHTSFFELCRAVLLNSKVSLDVTPCRIANRNGVTTTNT